MGENWKSRLKAHPLFVKLVEYGKIVDECAVELNKLNQKLEVLHEVPDEIRRWLPDKLNRKVDKYWYRTLNVGKHGVYLVSWMGGHVSGCTAVTINVRSIANGRISDSLFPMAYILGCVSDFEMLTLSANRKYRAMVQRLVKEYPKPERRAG